MTIIEIFVLIFLVVLVAGVVSYQVGKSYPPLKDMVKHINEIEIQAEDVTNELYNKELRTVAQKEQTNTEFPIDKPKKKKKYHPKKPKTTI